MKNIRNIWLVICLLAVLPAFCEISAGIKGGGNLQQTWSIDDGFSGARLGGGGGVFALFKFAEVIGIQPEIVYIMKGGKRSETKGATRTLPLPMQFDTTLTITNKMQYIEIPLLLKIFAPGYTVNAPHILIGPYYGYMLSRKVTAGGNLIQGSTVTSLDPAAIALNPAAKKGTDNVHDVGLVIGLGIDFGLGTFDIRYSLGFNGIETKGAYKDFRTATASINMGFLVYY